MFRSRRAVLIDLVHTERYSELRAKILNKIKHLRREFVKVEHFQIVQNVATYFLVT